MNEAHLTQRQQRERHFYDEYARRNPVEEVSLDPILGRESRPWNPYWAVYDEVRWRFRSPEQKLLDYGSGRGESAVVFARIGYDVSGFDIAPIAVAAARRLAEKYGVERRARFEVMAAEALDYPSEHFDLIVGIDILHHVDVARAVREALRTLKPGGTAIFREWVEVPVLDRVRNLRVVRWLVPNRASLEREITEDERKLTADDLKTIRALCPTVRVRRFLLVARFGRFFGDRAVVALERFDRLLFRRLPWLRPLGGSVILLLDKPW